MVSPNDRSIAARDAMQGGKVQCIQEGPWAAATGHGTLPNGRRIAAPGQGRRCRSMSSSALPVLAACCRTPLSWSDNREAAQAAGSYQAASRQPPGCQPPATPCRKALERARLADRSEQQLRRQPRPGRTGSGSRLRASWPPPLGVRVDSDCSFRARSHQETAKATTPEGAANPLRNDPLSARGHCVGQAELLFVLPLMVEAMPI